MKAIYIKEKILKEAAQKSMADFVNVVVEAIDEGIGRSLNSETMAMLNSDQITLLAYNILRNEISEGGFVQLIHNGYGAFIFKNPFAKALKEWGVMPVGQIVQKAHRYYGKYHDLIESDMSDDDFMALYEQCPEFDEFDDDFVDNEERYTAMVACYIDNNIQNFVEVEV